MANNMTVVVYLKNGDYHTYTDVRDVYIRAELPNVLQIRQTGEAWFYNMDEVKFYGVH